MTTSNPSPVEQAFAVWLTGLPASGKSTVARALVGQLAERGVRPAVLESDALRKVLTPDPTYSDRERDTFYGAMVHIGCLLVDHGVPVIFDATAHRRVYRDRARSRIRRFLEVHVDSPLAVCVQRDPKGIYRLGRDSGSACVPGVQVAYEPPPHADVTVQGDREDPHDAAKRIVAQLDHRRYIDH